MWQTLDWAEILLHRHVQGIEYALHMWKYRMSPIYIQEQSVWFWKDGGAEQETSSLISFVTFVTADVRVWPKLCCVRYNMNI